MIGGWGRELTGAVTPTIPTAVCLGWAGQGRGGRSHSFFCGPGENVEDEEETLRRRGGKKKNLSQDQIRQEVNCTKTQEEPSACWISEASLQDRAVTRKLETQTFLQTSPPQLQGHDPPARRVFAGDSQQTRQALRLSPKFCFLFFPRF